ncbi:prepilin peptidase dependent protein C [Paramixta manurensis]|uniref:Prepilin peptidase dependent protein C n=1 Tax=Paramixta manurensis TaxID=2740817 RepID=A0A6M8UCB9_9GAMM|nr:prepilin peptidase dependent protein C [Erwiniaceae bacterium PD-1]
MRRKPPRQSGFSLPEILLSLLLFSIGLVALLHYNQALTAGFLMQWQQRQAWRYAALRLEGYEPAGWRTLLSESGRIAACRLVTVRVISPRGREARLDSLYCERTPLTHLQ